MLTDQEQLAANLITLNQYLRDNETLEEFVVLKEDGCLACAEAFYHSCKYHDQHNIRYTDTFLTAEELFSGVVSIINRIMSRLRPMGITLTVDEHGWFWFTYETGNAITVEVQSPAAVD